jgi:hypothetical protein
MIISAFLAFWGLLVHVIWAALAVPTVVGLSARADEPCGGVWLSPVVLVEHLALTLAVLGYLWRHREAWLSRQRTGLLFGPGLGEWVALVPTVRLLELAPWRSG